MKTSLGSSISACLLTFNHVHIVESTLRSILDQTIGGFEVIVSDDCSTDGTWELILRLAANDPRVRTCRTPRNLGMPGNANFAVGQSSRPYIALLHQDDHYRPDLLEKWASVLERYADVGFVFNRYDGVPYRGAERAYERGFAWERLDGDHFLERFLLARWGSPVRGTAMIRKSSWDAVGGMKEEFGLVADVDLWMRLSGRWAVGYVGEPLIRVRMDRPDYYPDIYAQKKGWHWRRRVLVYEVFASNWRAHLALDTFGGRLRWWRFRVKLSCETTKWLIYAVVRKRPDIIRLSPESVTKYDLWPLDVLRRVLQSIASTTITREN